MLKFISRLFRSNVAAARAALECGPGRQRGVHGRLIGGLGMMRDTVLCCRCGREAFDERWSRTELRRAERACETLWPDIAAARALPGAMDERVAAPDPAFDAWFNSPLPNGELPSWVKKESI